MEVIDSGQMRVLSEFRCPDEADDNRVGFRLGVLGDDFIIASKAARGETVDANVIPTDEETDQEFDELWAEEYETEAEREAARLEMREHTKKSYADSIRRGWWQGNILFEKRNLQAIGDALANVLAGELVGSGERAFQIECGKDFLSIGAVSNWGHAMPAPEDRVTLQNLRDVELDGIEIGMAPLHIHGLTARKLNEEIGAILRGGEL